MRTFTFLIFKNMHMCKNIKKFHYAALVDQCVTSCHNERENQYKTNTSAFVINISMLACTACVCIYSVCMNTVRHFFNSIN